MGERVRITAGTVEMEAELNDTGPAQAVLAALPIETPGNTWGDEVTSVYRWTLNWRKGGRLWNLVTWDIGRRDGPFASFSGRRLPAGGTRYGRRAR